VSAEPSARHVLATFTRSDDLQGAELVDAACVAPGSAWLTLSGVVMREIDVREVDIDAPWLFKVKASRGSTAWP
jgi:hypothetical protein